MNRDKASPSSRRAWIEIFVTSGTTKRGSEVALLAEGVDRNTPKSVIKPCRYVALLAEGVDRNSSFFARCRCPARRPPRGGRG